MKRRTITVPAFLVMLIVAGVFLLGEAGARQESTPEPGVTTSFQSGYVHMPLPGETLAQDNTLEMTTLQVAASDEVGPYAHDGAAIYSVSVGPLTVTVTSDAAVIRLFNARVDDPALVAPLADCTAGCLMEAGDWLAFDSLSEVTLAATSDADAVLSIVSLTSPGGEASVITILGEDVDITRDGGHPTP